MEGIKRYIAEFGVMIGVYFAPVVPSLLLVALFVSADYIVGTKAARKKGEDFTVSESLRISIDKFTNYGIGLLIAQALELWVFQGSVPCLKLVMFMVISAEAQSVRENIKYNTGVDILKDPIRAMKKRK